PDQALRLIEELVQRAPARLDAVLAHPAAGVALLRVLGASQGLAEFLLRHPAQLEAIVAPAGLLAGPEAYRSEMLAAVHGIEGETAWDALRVSYRRMLLGIVIDDLSRDDALGAVEQVTAA